MSDPSNNKSDSDLSSNSSWSIIDESEESFGISVEKIELESDIDNQNSENLQEIRDEGDGFVNVSEKNSIEHSENHEKTSEAWVDNKQENKPRSKTEKSHKCKKKRDRKCKAEPLSVISIAASLLVITGLTLLCSLFPQNIEPNHLTDVQSKFAEIAVNYRNSNLVDNLNKTAEIIKVVYDADLLTKIQESIGKENFILPDNICPMNEEPYNNSLFEEVDPFLFSFDIKPTEKPIDRSVETESLTSFEQLQNTYFSFIKDLQHVLKNPSLQVFLCTIMQDLCLIRLVQQLNKNQALNETTDKHKTPKCEERKVKVATKSKSNKKSPKRKNKEKHLGNKLHINTENEQLEFVSPDALTGNVNSPTEKLDRKNFDSFTRPENGKSECELRFEQLETKWGAIGHNHRQKIQQIKEKFKNEVIQIKENEKELFQRRQRINHIRDKYVERLKIDRAKYIGQLKKLREERQKLMKDVCSKKQVNLYQKDASVGNYTVLLPGSYDFKQKLLALKKSEGVPTSTNLPSSLTVSVPKLNNSPKVTNDIKHQSIPNIPLQNNAFTTSNTIQESSQNEYLKKFQKYYDMKRQYLKRKGSFRQKSALVNKNSKTEVIEREPLIEEVTDSISPLSVSTSRLYHNFSNSSVETVKENENKNKRYEDGDVSKRVDELENDKSTLDADLESSVIENSKLESPTAFKKNGQKRDIYDLAFEKNGRKIKDIDMKRWQSERIDALPKNVIPTKQDPDKSYKEKIPFKGPM